MNNTKVKRIGIDARMYGPIAKGLGRYIQEIVDNILKIDEFNEYVVFLKKENFEEFQTDNPRVRKVIADVGWYTIVEQIKMPYYYWRERLDLVHIPHFNVPVFILNKFVVTIHDLILIRYPTARASTLGPILYKIKNFAYRFSIKLAVKRATKIIAVSNFTKKDIVDLFQIDEKKVEVTLEGVANLQKNRENLFIKDRDDKKTLLGYNIGANYLLYVGNAYPHKNLEGLLDVFANIKKKNSEKYHNLQLVLVGKSDYFYERTKEHAQFLGLWEENKENNNVVFPGFVDDTELEILYQQAIAYVFPSFYEGFGLPPLEAMTKGCPVISSNATSMPEILGEAAKYFNPKNKDEIKIVIENVLGNNELLQQMSIKGKEQSKKYSWWECARETHEIYNSILKSKLN